jgi:hypothetical protein
MKKTKSMLLIFGRIHGANNKLNTMRQMLVRQIWEQILKFYWITAGCIVSDKDLVKQWCM